MDSFGKQCSCCVSSNYATDALGVCTSTVDSMNKPSVNEWAKYGQNIFVAVFLNLLMLSIMILQ
jgi:hypothetical protein